MSEFEKRGIARFIKNLDNLRDPNYLTQTRKTTKVSGETVTNLVLWATDGSPFDTNRYFYDLGGNIYRETSGGTWSNLRTVSSAAGNGFLMFDDYLYYALNAELGRYGKLSGTPAFSDAFLSDGTTDKDPGTDASLTTGATGSTYAVTTSITETATHRQTFVPTRDPLKAIAIDIATVGTTADWTITVHDSNNTTIGSVTKANATLATQVNTFTFSTPLRVVPGNSYHYHVTATNTTGTPAVDTGTASDLEDSYFITYFGILISATWHPIAAIDDVVVIGNKDYLAYWDQATYNPNYIKLRAGMQVRSLASFDEFIVAAAFMGDTFEEAEFARLYFWDGIGTTINFYTDVTFGAPNVVCNHANNLFGVYGNRGQIKQGNSPFQTVRDIVPNLADGKVIEVYPGAITSFEDRLLIGYSGLTDDSSIDQGVYIIGSQSNEDPVSMSLGYVLSTGTTTGTSVKIGCVKSFGSDLYIGWRDGATYGVDKVAAGDTLAASGSWESTVFDGGKTNKDKSALNLVVTFESLASGETVTPKYDINRSGSFTTGTVGGSGDTRVNFVINKRFKEIEFGFDFTSSSNTALKITGIYFFYDDLEEEAREI